jgi:hypothetical protein
MQNQRAEVSTRRRLESERNESLQVFQAQADAAFPTVGLGFAQDEAEAAAKAQVFFQ